MNRAVIHGYSKDVRAATNFRGAEKSRVWLGVDILWPDGETEVIKGFITEHDAVKRILGRGRKVRMELAKSIIDIATGERLRDSLSSRSNSPHYLCSCFISELEPL